MASERQIAANRRNAGRSTGPRSNGGKKRASRNAYRHGLSLNIGAIQEFAESVNTLAQKIAGNSPDVRVLERARNIAEAELDLGRARQAKVMLIEHSRAVSALHSSQLGGRSLQDDPQDLGLRESIELDTTMADAVRR